MKLRNMLVAASILALPTAALAQPVDGFYVGIGAGYDYQLNTDVKQLTFRGQSRDVSGTTLQSNPGGPLGMVNFGYGFNNGFRVEVEGFYYYQTLKVASTQSGLVGKSHSNNYGGFLNGYYDFDVGESWVYPYVGIGIGYAATVLTGLNLTATNLGVSTSLDTNTIGSVAAQAIVGAAFPIPQVPGLSGTFDVRYFTTLQDLKFKGNAQNGDPFTIKVGLIGNVAGVIGLRYQLYTPPPPPPPAPAPTPVAAPSAHLSGVLRLGQVRPDRPREADHRRGGAELDAGAGTPASRSTVIPTSRAPRNTTRSFRCAAPRPSPPNWSRTACLPTRSPPRASARATRSCRPRRLCASRRTGASRSSSSSFASATRLQTGRAPRCPPFFCLWPPAQATASTPLSRAVAGSCPRACVGLPVLRRSEPPRGMARRTARAPSHPGRCSDARARSALARRRPRGIPRARGMAGRSSVVAAALSVSHTRETTARALAVVVQFLLSEW